MYFFGVCPAGSPNIPFPSQGKKIRIRGPEKTMHHPTTFYFNITFVSLHCINQSHHIRKTEARNNILWAFLRSRSSRHIHDMTHRYISASDDFSVTMFPAWRKVGSSDRETKRYCLHRALFEETPPWFLESVHFYDHYQDKRPLVQLKFPGPSSLGTCNKTEGQL